MIKSTKIVRQDTLFSDLHADVYRSETKQKGIFMNDEDIIDLFFDRKESAISETDYKYGTHLSTLAMRILNCREDVEECKNDTYLETWNTVPPTRPTNFLAYLMRLCRCDAFDRIEWKKAKKRHSCIVELTSEMAETIPDRHLKNDIEEWELGQLLSSFLASLPTPKRILFIKRYWFGLSIKELSMQYGIPENTVKTQLHRTREALKKYLRKVQSLNG